MPVYRRKATALYLKKGETPGKTQARYLCYYGEMNSLLKKSHYDVV